MLWSFSQFESDLGHPVQVHLHGLGARGQRIERASSLWQNSVQRFFLWCVKNRYLIPCSVCHDSWTTRGKVGSNWYKSRRMLIDKPTKLDLTENVQGCQALHHARLQKFANERKSFSLSQPKTSSVKHLPARRNRKKSGPCQIGSSRDNSLENSLFLILTDRSVTSTSFATFFPSFLALMRLHICVACPDVCLSGPLTSACPWSWQARPSSPKRLSAYMQD